MINAPAVSVIIPCYNACSYIGAAIDSVIEQNWPHIEIIVVDDGSDDGSAEVAAAHHARVRVIQRDNAGPGAARNAGIDAAQGEYIAFLDADDLWLPHKLDRQIELIQCTSGARMAYGSWHVWYSDQMRPSPEWLQFMDHQHQAKSLGAGPSGWVYCDLLRDTILNCSTVIAHRSVFDDVGTFDTALPIGEDYDLWLRASRATQILRVSVPVAIYRLHKFCTTRAVRDVNYQALVLGKALERWGYSGPDGSVADVAVVNSGLARIWREFAVSHLQIGNWGQARAASLRALSLRPFEIANLRVMARALLQI